LFVKPLNDGCHPDENSPGDHHQIGLARRISNHFGAEARDVI
jgi:hypothetical protein